MSTVVETAAKLKYKHTTHNSEYDALFVYTKRANTVIAAAIDANAASCDMGEYVSIPKRQWNKLEKVLDEFIKHIGLESAEKLLRRKP